MTYEDEANELAIRFSATRPSATRDTRKRSYVGDVRRLLDIETVIVTEQYE